MIFWITKIHTTEQLSQLKYLRGPGITCVIKSHGSTPVVMIMITFMMMN